MRRISSALVTVCGLAGCTGGPTAVGCTEEARPGIIVSVRNDATGAPAAEGAILTLTDGSFRQTVDETTIRGLVLFGAVERPGVYDVAVDKDGFEEWRREGVTVGLTPDGCHVVTVELEARLEPLEGT